MLDYEIWLDGVSNKDVGVVLQGAVEISSAVPRIETVEVPGRNGDLHIWDGSYENRTATVGAYVYRKDDVKDAFGDVNQWLLGKIGYRRIETDDDIYHYMLGIVQNGAEISARLRKLAPFEIEFDCKPQRFLTSGENCVIIESNTTLENPTIYTAKPLYLIRGNGDGILNIGSYTAEFKGIEEYIYYDEEMQTAYKESLNKNSSVNAPKGLPFEGGEQIINFSGGITSIEIIPRWWEL